MGNQALELPPNEFEGIESSYQVKAYLAPSLPEEFINLIRAPFLNSLRYGNELFKLIDQKSYYSIYGRFIDSLLNRPKSIVRMALLKDKTVLGWSLSEGETVHYVWVKKEVRRQGIAKAILPPNFTTISHITNQGMSLWNSKFPHVRFNPFI